MVTYPKASQRHQFGAMLSFGFVSILFLAAFHNGAEASLQPWNLLLNKEFEVGAPTSAPYSWYPYLDFVDWRCDLNITANSWAYRSYDPSGAVANVAPISFNNSGTNGQAAIYWSAGNNSINVTEIRTIYQGSPPSLFPLFIFNLEMEIVFKI
jgi:hypothetical protein